MMSWVVCKHRTAQRLLYLDSTRGLVRARPSGRGLEASPASSPLLLAVPRGGSEQHVERQSELPPVGARGR